MRVLVGFVRAVDVLTEWVGRITAWLTLVTVLVCATVVLLRYAFSIGFVWLQELYVWTYALVFMLGAGYALKRGGHVRVDIFYANMSRRARAMVDLFGTLLFLLPWLAVVGFVSWPYIGASWHIYEASAQTGGMPGLFLLKTALLGFCVLLGLQGLAVAARSLLVLNGREDLLPPADEARA